MLAAENLVARPKAPSAWSQVRAASRRKMCLSVCLSVCVRGPRDQGTGKSDQPNDIVFLPPLRPVSLLNSAGNVPSLPRCRPRTSGGWSVNAFASFSPVLVPLILFL
ncbi:hypothetical protein AAFF_G00389970 [Aldrovandia affinis]|uniref:Uncharacterized protein n=1 Tax=Aldrovandia affinis TaxID=143900 RepID=A0AAD7WLF3_9TELE|nr:hypothetical protein AAFF_G00389970 [Aldrovandia affinis]